MPRKEQGWVTFQTSEEERQILEEICQASQRTKTEILRELVRGLKESAEPASSPEPAAPPTKPARAKAKPKATTVELPVEPSSRKSLKVSSRNVLKGRVKHLVMGSVHTEVTLEIIHVVQLTSTITTTSAEELGLAEGKEAYAVIKSSDVVIAME